VPLFLFVILVAVGEDYNIFLMTRVTEEVERHDPVVGVTAAVGKSGVVLTSCGIIMAGTFATLLAGSLSELRQMGFAMSFGVLLDALVVRPILVPAFLLLIARRRERTATKPPAQLAPS
jgi:RND superfamily putative drug exporter